MLQQILCHLIKRLDIEIGQSYYQAISGLIGLFQPLFLERNGVVYILDSTMLSVGGFPEPDAITPSTYKTIQTNSTVDIINGYVVTYNENREAWDSYDEDSTTTVNIVTDEDEGTTTKIEETTFIRNYRRRSTPAVVVRTETISIVNETWIIDPVVYEDGDYHLVNRTTEHFEYDETGKILTRTKDEFARIPIWYPSVNPLSSPGDGYWQYDFMQVRYERDETTYKTNPYKRGTQYRDTFNQTARAFIYIDPDNIYETKDTAGVLEIDPDREVPVKYKQEYVTAVRSGILSEDGETEFGPVMSRFETVTPVNKDFSRVQTKEIDFINKVVTVNVAEEQIGEVSTSSQVSIQKRFVAFAAGGLRDNGRLDSLNIGEVPLGAGIALAQRKLARQNGQQYTLTMVLFGFDTIIDRGSVIGVNGRNDEYLGAHLVEGYTIDGKSLGTDRQTIETTIESLKI
jgi:hypothetical protein